MSLDAAERHIADFLLDWPMFSVVQITPEVVEQASRLLKKHSPTRSLRPMDAIHLGSALHVKRNTGLKDLLTTDRTLGSLAEIEGLSVAP